MTNLPSMEGRNIEHFSEAELIALIPDKQKGEKRDPSNLTAQERLVLDELWIRHAGNVEDNLRAKIFAKGSTLCPEQEPDKKHFLMVCMNEAYQIFLRRVGRKEYENFGGFLFILALNAAMDARDKIASGMPPRRVVTDVDDMTDRLVGEDNTAPRTIEDQERRRIIMKVMQKHAKESSLSTNVVLHRAIGDRAWKEMAEKLVPPEILGKSLRTRIRAVKEFYKRDRSRTLELLKEENITDLRHI